MLRLISLVRLLSRGDLAAAAVDPTEVQSLHEQLEKAQGKFVGLALSSRGRSCQLQFLPADLYFCAADTAEVSQLREKLKGAVTMPELAAKLGE